MPWVGGASTACRGVLDSTGEASGEATKCLGRHLHTRLTSCTWHATAGQQPQQITAAPPLHSCCMHRLPNLGFGASGEGCAQIYGCAYGTVPFTEQPPGAGPLL